MPSDWIVIISWIGAGLIGLGVFKATLSYQNKTLRQQQEVLNRMGNNGADRDKKLAEVEMRVLNQEGRCTATTMRFENYFKAHREISDELISRLANIEGQLQAMPNLLRDSIQQAVTRGMKEANGKV